MEEVLEWLDVAAEFGFKTVQPVFFWANYTEEDFNILEKGLALHRLSAPVLGVYSDLLKWDRPTGAVFESTIQDLFTAASCAYRLNARYLATWCGTMGEYGTPCAENSKMETRQRFKAHQQKLLPMLEEHALTLLFEPWRDHVLADEFQTAEACRLDPDRFGVVLDPPNFISPAQWPRRCVRVREIVNALQPHIRMAHLKDIALDKEGQVELPMFGSGQLSGEIAKALRPYVGQIPIIAEHLETRNDVPALLDAVARSFYGKSRESFA